MRRGYPPRRFHLVQSLCFDAFSSREPAPTSLENAIVYFP
jgi:hypothetical protein